MWPSPLSDPFGAPAEDLAGVVEGRYQHAPVGAVAVFDPVLPGAVYFRLGCSRPYPWHNRRRVDQRAAQHDLEALTEAFHWPAERDLRRARQATVRQLYAPAGRPVYRTRLIDMEDAFAAAPALLDKAPKQLTDVSVYDVDAQERVVRARTYAASGSLLSETLIRPADADTRGVTFDRDGDGWRPVGSFVERRRDGRVVASADLVDDVMDRREISYDDLGRPREVLAARWVGGTAGEVFRYSVQWGDGSHDSPDAVLELDGVLWRRRGPHRKLREAAEQALGSDIAGALERAAADDPKRLFVVLRHQRDGTWSDQCLPTVAVRFGRGAWDLDAYTDLDVQFGEPALDALSALDGHGRPRNGAPRSLLRTVSGELTNRPGWSGGRPVVVVTDNDPVDFAADVRHDVAPPDLASFS
ncbi:MAG: hypothetical protein QOE86_1906 [Solirubrobacteraceae bacterium]|nr:hypothetical protein [Solirubrobacteraceae bacterium]